ncbi:hypothetical protein ACJX0J_035543 [Zea mays]
MIGGDFNLIYRVEDKNNGNLNRAMMGRFRRLMEGFMDESEKGGQHKKTDAVVDERSTPDIGKRRILLEKSRFSLVMCSSSPSLLTRKTQVERPWTETGRTDISGGLTAVDVHLQTGVPDVHIWKHLHIHEDATLVFLSPACFEKKNNCMIRVGLCPLLESNIYLCFGPVYPFVLFAEIYDLCLLCMQEILDLGFTGEMSSFYGWAAAGFLASHFVQEEGLQ